MSKFQLSKWYMDCVSDAGDVVVAYCAELRWGPITLPYASLLVRCAGETARAQSTVRRSAPPDLAKDSCSWAHADLAVSGRWTGLAPPFDATLFESSEGSVHWQCLLPRARCEMRVGGRAMVGLGYVERLSLTLAPWRLPINELRWGRFLGNRSALVWVDWRGVHTTQRVVLDGDDLGPSLIDEHSVTSQRGGVRMVISDAQVLRRGALGDTVLSHLRAIGRLPARILAVDETKWCARGSLEDSRGADSGWVIHEVVRWPPASRHRTATRWVGKLLYGLLFAAVFPILLFLWARATGAAIRGPAWRDPLVGGGLSVAGALLVVFGWAGLWVHGGGLPMNAYPPPRYAVRGIYALVSHPIYTGFAALCFGFSIASGSTSGLWLVSPTVALGCVALVAGFERRDLESRFPGALRSPWLSLPPDDNSPPSVSERLTTYVLGLSPWVLASAKEVRTLDWGVYTLALGAPLVLRSRKELRTLVVRALLAVPLVFPMHLVVPAVTPSFRVVLALLAADAWASRAPRASLPTARSRLRRGVVETCWILLALVLSGRDVAAAHGGLAGFVASAGAYAIVGNATPIWQAVRRLTERLANSWAEVRIGRVRIINHGGWAALGTFGGVAIVGSLIGSRHLPAILLAALAALVGSALWAQWIEGSPALLRPVGFYGGVLGICLAAFFAPLLGTSVWLLLGAYAVAGPYVQAMGRVRCLVQGCCHGGEASGGVGILYRHPRSRVCRLANLANVPIHATPLYSILWNIVTAVVMVRLWSLRAPLHILGGVYLILNGLGRFVEEAFRGEPQTPIVARLRLYQWIAIGSAVSGALVTALGSSATAPAPAPSAASLVAGLLFGLLTWFALGVDFPESTRRFSRLA